MRLWEPEDGMALANQRLKHLVLSERQAGCECLSQDVQEVWDMLRATPRATALALSLYHLRVRFCEHCRTDASVSGLMALKNLVA